MGRGGGAYSLAAGDREHDPVLDVEACILAGLLDGADEVTGEAFGGQIRRHDGVEDDEGSARHHPDRDSVPGRTGDGLEGVLPLLQRETASGDQALGRDRPVARLRALDRLLDLTAQTRTGSTS